MKQTSSGAYVGSTPELLRLMEEGHTVKSAMCDFPLEYRPRSKHDPLPWRSHGSENGFRYSSREAYAEPKPEPTLEDYAQASRIIQSLIPGVNR